MNWKLKDTRLRKRLTLGPHWTFWLSLIVLTTIVTIIVGFRSEDIVIKENLDSLSYFFKFPFTIYRRWSTFLKNKSLTILGLLDWGTQLRLVFWTHVSIRRLFLVIKVYIFKPRPTSLETPWKRLCLYA